MIKTRGTSWKTAMQACRVLIIWYFIITYQCCYKDFVSNII